LRKDSFLYLPKTSGSTINETACPAPSAAARAVWSRLTSS
jgi:hypothetical protein